MGVFIPFACVSRMTPAPEWPASTSFLITGPLGKGFFGGDVHVFVGMLGQAKFAAKPTAGMPGTCTTGVEHADEDVGMPSWPRSREVTRPDPKPSGSGLEEMPHQTTLARPMSYVVVFGWPASPQLSCRCSCTQLGEVQRQRSVGRSPPLLIE